MLNTVGRSLFERKPRSYLNLIVNVFLVIVSCVLLFEIWFNLRFESILVEGRSMLPTIVGEEYGVKGEYVFVDTSKSPDYGDIVVVEYPSGGTVKRIIKRAIAFGGDTVKMESGNLYIKYAEAEGFSYLEEPYVSPYYCNPNNPYNSFEEHTVAEGCIFLLGDNRNESADSRQKSGDYLVSEVVGVVPDWVMEHKNTITAVYSFLRSLMPYSDN